MVDSEPPTTESPAAPPGQSPLPPCTGDAKPLAKIVHELRNPLSAFTTALHLLDSQPDRPDLVRQLAGLMTQQVNRFTQIIDELAACANDYKTKSSPEAVPNTPMSGALPNRKILLVDDNQSATHMMSRLLEKLGQQVQIASSAAAVLEQLSTFAPDCVISDIAMPGMSGYDLARRIRELDLPQRPYLVAVTGYGQESDRQEALAAGFDRHMTKPIGVAALEDLLRNCRA